MKKFNIFIQNKLYKTIEAPNTGDALAYAAKHIKAGKVTFLDKSKDPNVKIENAN